MNIDIYYSGGQAIYAGLSIINDIDSSMVGSGEIGKKSMRRLLFYIGYGDIVVSEISNIYYYSE